MMTNSTRLRGVTSDPMTLHAALVELRPDAKNHIILDAQNVNDYLWETRQIITYKDLPCVRPPWNNTVVLFREGGNPNAVYLWDDGSGKIAIQIAMVSERGVPLPIQVAGFITIDTLGRVIRDPIWGIFGKDVAHLSKIGHDNLNQIAGSAFITAAFAIALCHVKGSTIDTRPPSPFSVLSKRTKVLPSFTRHIVRIEAIDKVVSDSRRRTSKDSSRVHLVRGHFKDCREHGIAGNPKSKGIYWWHPHARGDRAKGMIEKDYKSGELINR